MVLYGNWIVLLWYIITQPIKQVIIAITISVVPIIGLAIGNSRLLENFVTIGIGRF